MSFTGAASRITSLAAQKKILELAEKNNREVWFDVHIWTDGPAIAPSVDALPSYIDAIDKVAGNAKHRVLVFELNANNHEQRRALANALAIGRATRDGRLPIVTSANALQVDKQNDNGWDQGLLFMNPASTWIEPPGYVTQMISRSYEPRVLEAEVSKADPLFDVTAVKSEDGRILVLRVVNLSGEGRACEIRLDHFTPSKADASVVELSAPLDATNTAAQPDRVKPRDMEWKHDATGNGRYMFPAHSFTVLKVE
jgi:alpha-L-arabinofuranosidase-like protein